MSPQALTELSMKWHVSCKVISSDYVFLRWPSPEGVPQKLQASTVVLCTLAMPVWTILPFCQTHSCSNGLP